MSRVRDFFVEEAMECMAVLRSELNRPDPEPKALYAAARQLRGSAQVARFGALAKRAGALESLCKGVVRQGGHWDEALSAEARDVVKELERDVEAVREGRTDQDEREPMTDEQTEGTEATEGVGPVTMPLDALEYRGEAALDRAVSLRQALEEAIVNEQPPGPVLDELFDLIELGRK